MIEFENFFHTVFLQIFSRVCYNENVKGKTICFMCTEVILVPDINYKMLKRDFWLVNILIGSAVLLTLFFLLLQHTGVLPSFPCVLYMALGIYCPGCGGTRALRALLGGHFIRSLRYNPAVICGILLILYYELGAVITLVKKNGKRYMYHKMWPLAVYLSMVAVFTVARDVLLLAAHIDILKAVG